jgi:hypothetical protein
MQGERKMMELTCFLVFVLLTASGAGMIAGLDRLK